MEWNNADADADIAEDEAKEEGDHGPRCSCWGCRSHGRGKGLLVQVLALFLVIASVLWIVGYLGFSFRPFAATGGSGDWKAVFLTNGQVYFGRVQNEQADPLVLTDIYYLQVQQQLQPSDPNQQPQQSLQLIKFGNELHGPRDQMRITRRNVLYIESLKEDGRVVDAIVRYLAEQEGNQ